jgi:hypothetical protein
MATKDQKPEHAGDVLGLSDAPSDVTIPRATTDRGGHPQGIEIEPSHDHDALKQSKGATGIDMGAGGEGTDIEP